MPEEIDFDAPETDDGYKEFLQNENQDKQAAAGAAVTIEETFLHMPASFWLNLIAIICNLVTLVNMLFEGQIVVQMCLEFIDEDDEAYKYSDLGGSLA